MHILIIQMDIACDKTVSQKSISGFIIMRFIINLIYFQIKIIYFPSVSHYSSLFIH